MTLLFAFLIGFFGGLRSLTAPAATAWAVYLGWLKLERPLVTDRLIPSGAIFTCSQSLSWWLTSCRRRRAARRRRASSRAS